MDRIFNMIVRMVMRQVMRKGAGMAMQAGQDAWNKRKARKTQSSVENIDQDPAVTNRRKLRDDERKGDDVLYPTDEFTEDMQPRR